jgi:DNA-binding IclR family transcriptional regulator
MNERIAADKILALDRGANIMMELMATRRSYRFSELKTALVDISDASLNRLLKAMIASGVICKDERGNYFLAPRVMQLINQPTEAELVTSLTHRLGVISQQIKESVGLLKIEGDNLLVMYAENYPESVSVDSQRGSMYFEADHAACLEIMRLQPEEELRRLMKSPNSRSSFKDMLSGIKSYCREGYSFDQSKERLGISRLAVHLTLDHSHFAAFVVSTTDQIQAMEQQYVEALMRLKEIEGIS